MGKGRIPNAEIRVTDMALNTGLFNVAPGESPKEGDSRRRLAMALMQEGMSTDPIKSPWQGVANLAKSLIGGYDIGKMDQEDKAKELAMQQGLNGWIGSLSGEQTGAAPQPSPVASALSGGPPRPPGMIPGYNGEPPRPKVASSASVMGDDEARAAGLYEGSPSPGTPAPGTPMPRPNPMRSPVAAALAGPQPAATPATPPERRTPTIGPQEAAQLRALAANPQMRAPLAQHLMDLSKPKDQWEERKDQTGQTVFINRATGEPKYPPAGTNMAVTTVADPVLKGVGEQLMDARQKAITAANQSIPAIHEARRAIDQGAITGALSDPRLFISKVGSLFGLADANRIANTEQLTSALGTQLLANAKALGQNPSNADATRIDQILGTKNLDEKSLRELLDIQERWARDSIKRHNRDAEKLMRGNPKMYEQIAPIMSIEEPGVYARPVKPGTGSPTAARPQRTIRYDAQGNPL
jgi:hypothetical protein